MLYEDLSDLVKQQQELIDDLRWRLNNHEDHTTSTIKELESKIESISDLIRSIHGSQYF